MLADVSVLPLRAAFFLDRDWGKSFQVYDPLCHYPELKNSAGDVASDTGGWHVSHLYTGGLVSHWKALFRISADSVAVVIRWADRYLVSLSFSQLAAAQRTLVVAADLNARGASVSDLFLSGRLNVGDRVQNVSGGVFRPLNGVVEHVFPSFGNETLDLYSIAIEAMGQGMQPVPYITLQEFLAGKDPKEQPMPATQPPGSRLINPRYAYSFSAGLGWSIQAELVMTQQMEESLVFDKTEFVYRNTWEDRLFSSQATNETLSNARFIDFELPGHAPAASEWPSMRALLEKLPTSSHLEWLEEHHAQFDAAQAADLKPADPCQTYLHGVEAETEVSLESLVLKYTECHAAILRGDSEPRFLVFRWHRDSDIGFGNMVAFMTTAFLNAIVFRRAFLIDHESFRTDLRDFLAPPSFEWDFRSAVGGLSQWTSLETAIVGGSCRELVEDTAPVLVVHVAPCVTMTSFMTDDSFRKFLPLFPSRQPALMVGALSHVLFQPGPVVRELMAETQEIFRTRTVIGIAVRHSSLPDDHMMFIDNMETVAFFQGCAKEVAASASVPENVMFFIMSDVLYTKQVLTSAHRRLPRPISDSAFAYELPSGCSRVL